MENIHSFDEVFDGQKVFRKVLDAMSNPGRYVSISEEADKLYGSNRSFLALAITLIDNEVSFYAFNDTSRAKDISMLTLSEEKNIEDADFIFVCNDDELREAVGRCKTGTLADPQKSATIIVAADGNRDKEITIYGAGVDGKRTIKVPQIVESAIKLRDEQEYEYPQGIDFVFVTDSDELMCIPRLVMKEEK